HGVPLDDVVVRAVEQDAEPGGLREPPAHPGDGVAADERAARLAEQKAVAGVLDDVVLDAVVTGMVDLDGATVSDPVRPDLVVVGALVLVGAPEKDPMLVA